MTKGDIVPLKQYSQMEPMHAVVHKFENQK